MGGVKGGVLLSISSQLQTGEVNELCVEAEFTLEMMQRPSRACSRGCKAPVWSRWNLDAHCLLGGCHPSLQTLRKTGRGQGGRRNERSRVFCAFTPMCTLAHTHRHSGTGAGRLDAVGCIADKLAQVLTIEHGNLCITFQHANFLSAQENFLLKAYK